MLNFGNDREGVDFKDSFSRNAQKLYLRNGLKENTTKAE